jgi:cysteinyl-tRNA synthetase
MDAGEFGSGNVAGARAVLELFDSVFQVLEVTRSTDDLTDDQINTLVAERTHAKKARDFKRADAIRADLEAKGIILEDTKDGVRWKRK